MIMVGPGTGIAPFRAFLEERQATGAKGKNWLFFGDQKKDTDFLYDELLTGWQTSGFLTRLDLAFSRDGRYLYTTSQSARPSFGWRRRQASNLRARVRSTPIPRTRRIGRRAFGRCHPRCNWAIRTAPNMSRSARVIV
jgi:hypothetical protein